MAVLANIKAAITRNAGLKLISLGIAIIIWLLIITAKETTSWEDVRLSYRLPDDKSLTVDLPDSMRILVKGPWTAISTWNKENLSTPIDLSKSPLGQSVVYLNSISLRLPPAIKIVNVAPAQIKVFFERKLEKQVDVVAELKGELSRGYKLMEPSVTLEPRRTMVTGPESEISLLQAVRTEPIEVGGYTEPFEVTVSLASISPRILFAGKNTVRATVHIEKDVISKQITGVEVKPVPADERLSVSPRTVRVFVRGLRPLVENLAAKDIVATVDASQGTGTFDVTVDLDERVSLVRVTPATVRVMAGSDSSPGDNDRGASKKQKTPGKTQNRPSKADTPPGDGQPQD